MPRHFNTHIEGLDLQFWHDLNESHGQLVSNCLLLLVMMFSCLCVHAFRPITNKSNLQTTERDHRDLFSDIIANTLPKEKVYQNLDNTIYYRNDTLWFSAYLVNSDGNTSDAVSKTLYVDLLNPEGDIIIGIMTYGQMRKATRR